MQSYPRVSHARLTIIGDEFWDAAGVMAGKKVVKAAKLTLHPVALIPTYMSADGRLLVVLLE